MRHFARVQHHFINGSADALLAILLAHLYFQQKPFLSDVVTLKHIGQLLLRIIGVKIGQKAQIAAVNANHFDVVTRQRARCAKHIAIAADHHRQIRLLTNVRQRTGSHIREFQLMGNALFNHHVIAFGMQPAVEHFMCGERGRVARVPDNTNTLEMLGHFLRVLVANE